MPERRSGEMRTGHPYKQPEIRPKNVYPVLSKTPWEILSTEPVSANFIVPPPMIGNPERKNADRYCEFHRDKGHYTNDCFHLKKQIEEAVKTGQLAHLVINIRSEANRGSRGQGKGKNPRGKVREVHMLWGERERYGDRKRKRQDGNDWMDQVISFPRGGEFDPSQQPIVVEGRIGNTRLPKIYVDTGSSTEVLYEHFFQRLHPGVQARLRRPESQLQGFSGEVSWPIGEIDLPLTVGCYPHMRTEVMRFAVVNAPSPYNAILGRPGIYQLGAVPSSLHAMIKFPTPHGIATLRSERRNERECRLVKKTEDA